MCQAGNKVDISCSSSSLQCRQCYIQHRTRILTFEIDLESGKIFRTCTKLILVAISNYYGPNRTGILTFGKKLESGKILRTCTKLLLVPLQVTTLLRIAYSS